MTELQIELFMGLDSVELLLAIEDEFGLDIPNADAERMCTVGDIFDHLKQRLVVGRSNLCNSQRCFHRLRQAICATYNVPRRAIRPDSKLIDFIPKADLRAGWPYLQLYTYLKLPKNDRTDLLSTQRVSEALAIRELVASVMSLNNEVFPPEVASEQELWERLVNVIHRQSMAPLEDIQKDARITNDLGID